MSRTGDLEIGLCWGTLINASLTELIDAAARHGFTTLSVRPDSIVGLLNDGMSDKALRRRLRDAGVRIRVIDALGGGLPGMDARTALSIAQGNTAPADEATCFRTAEAVECPMINVSLFGGDPVPQHELADAIGAVSRRAAKHGFDMVLEFVPGTAIGDIHVARAIVEQCGASNCRILLDPWHLARSGGTLEDVMALPQGMIGSVQLDDRTPPEPGAPYVPMSGRDLPGEGQLPLHDIVRAALANNPGLTAEVEVFSEELRAMPTDEAASRVACAVAAWRAAL